MTWKCGIKFASRCHVGVVESKIVEIVGSQQHIDTDSPICQICAKNGTTMIEKTTDEKELTEEKHAIYDSKFL